MIAANDFSKLEDVDPTVKELLHYLYKSPYEVETRNEAKKQNIHSQDYADTARKGIKLFHCSAILQLAHYIKGFYF